MSVSVDIALPDDQPSSGSYTYVPLGGNGFTAPHACYLLQSISVAGDASGGTAQVGVTLDPRYQGLISVVQADQVGTTADVDVRYTIQAEDPSGNIYSQISVAGTLKHLSFENNARGAWSPPSVFNASKVLFKAANVNGDTYAMSGIIYLFNKRASELTPLSVLLSSLPRAQHLIPA